MTWLEMTKYVCITTKPLLVHVPFSLISQGPSLALNKNVCAIEIKFISPNTLKYN